MQSVLANNYSPTIYDEPFRAREHAIPGRGARLRSMIDDTVVAFVPPSLPLVSDPGIIVTDALAQLSSDGGWAMWIRVEAVHPVPTFFLAGISTTHSAHWGGMGQVLNDSGNPNARVFFTLGASAWIAANYGAAAAEGVTFRAVSTTNLDGSLHDIAVVWRDSFDQGLGRAFSLIDTDKNYYYEQQAAAGIGESEALDDPPDDDRLSFGVSLRFE